MRLAFACNINTLKPALVLLIFFASPLFDAHGQSLPAFPGAQGFGSRTPGGRGGSVYFVTTLNPTGAGSISEAVAATGPRFVIFKVGGIIDFTGIGELNIENPYLTIAGQTAPGDGIMLKNCRVRIVTHDVIIRGLRVRIGDLPGGLSGEARDGMTVMQANQGGSYNVIVDHCSFSWSVDENVEVIGSSHDITIQYCYISEALDCTIHPKGCHSKSLSAHNQASGNISFHHNVVAHGWDRNPQLLAPGSLECVNNVVYNYGYGGRFGNNTGLHFIGNRYIPGASTILNRNALIHDADDASSPLVYVEGNIGPGRPTNTGDEWLISDASTIYRSLNLLFTPQVIADDVDLLWPSILDKAGALPHDPVDVRTYRHILSGTGDIIDSQSEVGGWPIMASGTSPLDTDNDGMPNVWEIANGLNPTNPGDANADGDSDGYHNIEEYLNGLVVDYPTLAYAGPDQNLCGLTSTTLAGNIPLLGVGQWSVVTGPATIASPGSPTSAVSGLRIGVNEFEWRIFLSGFVTTRDTVRITVYELPTAANAGPDQQLCESSSTTLSGNTPLIGQGQWSVILGPAIIVNPANPVSQVTGLQVGDNQFEWVITGDGNCVSRDTVMIMRFETPSTADAGSDETLCDDTTDRLNGNDPAIGTGLWRVLVGPAVVEDPTSWISDVNGLQVGINEFEWSISNGSCLISRDTVVITMAESPVGNFSFTIAGTTVTFTNLSMNATSYLWSFGDGGTSAQTNPVHTYANLTSYRVTLRATNLCGTSTVRRRVSLAGTSGILSVSPTSLDFGAIPVGSIGQGTVSVSNVGDDTLDIDYLTIDQPTGFSTPDTAFSIAPEVNKSLTIVFSPDTALGFSAKLVISTQDSVAIVSLKGSGTDSLIIQEKGIPVISGGERSEQPPSDFLLFQNYPNPFNPSTIIRYGLSKDGWVTVKVFDILGQEIVVLVDGFQTAGYWSAVWDGKNKFGEPVAGGLYYYRLAAGDNVRIQKMLLVR